MTEGRLGPILRMEAASLSETFLCIYQLHGDTPQKTSLVTVTVVAGRSSDNKAIKFGKTDVSDLPENIWTLKSVTIKENNKKKKVSYLIIILHCLTYYIFYYLDFCYFVNQQTVQSER